MLITPLLGSRSLARVVALASVASLASCVASFALAGCTARAPAGGAPAPVAASAAAPSHHPIRFIEDDYPRALAEARASHKPLFVDAWATWCHTCVSMKAYVFPDPKLDAYADRFVWLSIDTEKPENARFVETHPMRSWPTLWVLDAEAQGCERVALKWSNSANADELGSLLDDASLAMKRGDRGADAGAALVRGNQATAEGKADEAIAEYRAALSLAPRDWPKRANAVEALVTRLSEKKDDAACAQTTADELPRIAGGTSRATAALLGLECASRLPVSEPRAASLKADLLASIRTMAMDPREPILADDRSGLFEGLVDALDEEKKEKEAHDAAAAWATFLEGEAARASTPAARAVFDAHRLEAYEALGQPERALPMLEASARDFPGDYNPHARLARAFKALHRYREGLTESDRALALAYGPRRLRVFAVKADILEAMGDRPGAAAVLRAGVAESKTMTLTGGQPKLVADLERRAQTLDPAAAAR